MKSGNHGSISAHNPFTVIGATTMSWTITVDNIKCGGCANSITKALRAIAGITSVRVDYERGEVCLEGDEAARPAVTGRLLELGYPEIGAVSGLRSATAKAKSFVSCAVGRMSEKR
jgi:copper chaperone